jgi:RNA polymerase sigma-70 factor (ECF subfamily)
MTRTTHFERLFSENYSFVVRYCEARLADSHRAEDAAAETFRIAWVRYREPATRRWLTTIAHHVIGNEYRRRTRTMSLEHRLRTSSPASDDTTGRVREAVRLLDEPDRLILYLTYWVGLNATETAGVLRISVPACWARLTRARDRLRRHLAEEP